MCSCGRLFLLGEIIVCFGYVVILWCVGLSLVSQLFVSALNDISLVLLFVAIEVLGLFGMVAILILYAMTKPDFVSLYSANELKVYILCGICALTFACAILTGVFDLTSMSLNFQPIKLRWFAYFITLPVLSTLHLVYIKRQFLWPR